MKRVVAHRRSRRAACFACAVGIVTALAAPSFAQMPEEVKRLPPTWPMTAAVPTGLVEVFPHVRVDRAARIVEFDGTVCVDVHQGETPRVEIEVLVCLPMRDKEMESLVLSAATGAHVHAAMLLAGFVPGEPGRIEFPRADDAKGAIKRVAPTGDRVKVRFEWEEKGASRSASPLEWIVDERTFAKGATDGPSVAASPEAPVFVFGGGGFAKRKDETGVEREVYAADSSGTLISWCTFGTETIGVSKVYSPDSGIDTPWWLARAAAVPAFGTPVRVRIGVP